MSQNNTPPILTTSGKKDLSNGFTQIPNSHLMLFLSELGKNQAQLKFMLYLYSLPDNFRLSEKTVCSNLSFSHSTYIDARKSLCDRGWITYIQYKSLQINYDRINIDADAFIKSELRRSMIEPLNENKTFDETTSVRYDETTSKIKRYDDKTSYDQTHNNIIKRFDDKTSYETTSKPLKTFDETTSQSDMTFNETTHNNIYSHCLLFNNSNNENILNNKNIENIKTYNSDKQSACKRECDLTNTEMMNKIIEEKKHEHHKLVF